MPGLGRSMKEEKHPGRQPHQKTPRKTDLSCGESEKAGYLTLARVSLRAFADAWRPWSSFGQSSSSMWLITPARPTTVGTLMLMSRIP